MAMTYIMATGRKTHLLMSRCASCHYSISLPVEYLTESPRASKLYSTGRLNMDNPSYELQSDDKNTQAF